MGKFKSWLQGSNAGSSRLATAEEKKANRRSFSGIGQLKAKREPRNDTGTNEEESEMTTSLPDMQKATPVDSRLIQLAKIISAETDRLEQYCSSQGIPSPSFEADARSSFPKLPDNIQRSRQEIVSAANELSCLARGPHESVRWGVWGVSENDMRNTTRKY